MDPERFFPHYFSKFNVNQIVNGEILVELVSFANPFSDKFKTHSKPHVPHFINRIT